MVDTSHYTLCPHCSEELSAGELEERFLCGKCGSEYNTEQEAERCCMEEEPEEVEEEEKE